MLMFCLSSSAMVFNLVETGDAQQRKFDALVEEDANSLVKGGTEPDDAKKISLKYWKWMREKHPILFR